MFEYKVPITQRKCESNSFLRLPIMQKIYYDIKRNYYTVNFRDFLTMSLSKNVFYSRMIDINWITYKMSLKYWANLLNKYTLHLFKEIILFFNKLIKSNLQNSTTSKHFPFVIDKNSDNRMQNCKLDKTFLRPFK